MKRSRRTVLGTIETDKGKFAVTDARIAEALSLRQHENNALRERLAATEHEVARRGLLLGKLNDTQWVRLGRRLGFISSASD